MLEYTKQATMKKLIVIFLFLSTLINAQSFTNPSFEIWGNPNACAVNASPAFWMNYSIECVAVDEANFPLCPTSIPPNPSDGSIYARACASMNGGEGIYQNVSGFTVGSIYQITFDYAGSNLAGGSDDVQWHLYIDDVDVNQTPAFASSDSIWATRTFTFIATMPTHKIGVRAYSVTNFSGAGSAALDNFTLSNLTSIEAMSPGVSVHEFPNPCKEKFTLELNNNLESELIVYDLLSRKVFQQKLVKKLTVNTSSFQKGLYMYEIRCQGVICKKGKLVKE